VRPVVESLAAALHDRSTLLVLDNVEHILAAAPRVAELLARCPRLTVLATSRAPLRLREEQEFAVRPLALPPAGAIPTVEILGAAAVALFVERAGRVQPGFALTDDTAAAVAAVCRCLDGLPLAIELAAARLRILTPATLLGRLEHRLTVLTGGARDLPARQQTLRDTIAWSYDLLTSAQQTLFRRLAVFAGGCTLEAAEAVGRAVGDPDLNVLEGLASLVEQSLLRQEAATGTPRFAMLETIREFARDHLLASLEAEAVRDAHLAFVRELIARGEVELRGAGRLAWLNEVAVEHDNIRAALDWSLTDSRRAEHGLAIAAGLYWFWHLRGHHTEARGWIARLLAAAPDAPPALRAHVLANAGVHAYFQSDLAASRTLLDASVALSRASEARWCLAWALGWFGSLLVGEGAAARAYAEESTAIFTDLGDTWYLASSFFGQGMAALRRGDTVAARAAFEAYIAALEQLGDRWTPAPAYGQLGRLAYNAGDYPRARGLLEECVERMRAIDDWPGLPGFVNLLGELTRLQGDPTGAVALLQEAIRLSHRYGSRQYLALGLAWLAAMATAVGEHARAARLCGAAEAVPASVRALLILAERTAYDQVVAAVHARLDDPVLATAWAEGQALSVDDAVRAALEPWDVPSTRETGERPSVPTSRLDSLSDREREVLRLVAVGKNNPEIAAALVISVNTVYRHVSNIFDKTGATNRVEAAAYAQRHGLV
jgi:predicted ATPase/DNA-binding NarL/FixJ family response regulator